MALCACEEWFNPELPSRDAELTGLDVQQPWLAVNAKKVFVLNEGGMGSNNSTLDFLRMSDCTYITDVFKKMNPDVATGLGDVGNDIAVNGEELWIVVNNSGIVEVLSARDETEIAAVTVPTPRNIAFDGNYAYVTSWAGAYAAGSYDENGNYTITDSKNPKGQVYRIDLKTKEVKGSVEVGYQPEGIAFYDGKLYVANSGGISSQLPPSYSYDNTVSIIDAASFEVVQTVVVEINLKNVYSDGKGMIYVRTLGDYWSVHSGIYAFSASNPTVSQRLGGDTIKPDALNVSCSCMVGNTLFCIGTENEFDWNSQHSYSLWSFTLDDFASMKGHFSFYPIKLSGTPYGMAILEQPSISGMGDPIYYLLLGDAGDYFNPGTVSCYSLGSDEKYWSVTAGVCPGHFAIY